MVKTVKNTHTEYHCDKLDVAATSSLSLFLYPKRLIVQAKDQNGLVTGVNDYPYLEMAELKMIISNDQFIQQNVPADLLFFNQDFSLVPGILFDQAHPETYLNFSTEPYERHTCFSSVENQKIIVVGGIEKEVEKLFKKHLSHFSICHGASLILAYLLLDKSEMLNQEIAIVIEDGQIYLAGFNNKELKLFNRFEVSGGQDFLKYTFSALHQLAFDRMHCKITLFGDLKDIQLQEEVLHQYFKNILLSTPKSNLNYLPGAEGFKETKKLAAFWTF